MIWFSLAVALPTIAWTLLLTRLSGDRHGFLRHVPTAVGLGIGTASVLWWAVMLLPLASWTAVVGIDATFWALACVIAWRVTRSQATRTEDGPPRSNTRWLPHVVVAVVIAEAGVYFLAASATAPHGQWDAWAIWNARARFLFRGYPDVWTQAFSPALEWSHPDYPLLLPVSVVRAWTYIGSEHTAAPILLAATFSAGIVLTAAAAVGRAASAWRGVLTAVMILASPAFLTNAVSQCADIPLAFYILTTCVLVGRATEAGSDSGWWLAAGVAAGLAAWTKNEGLVFAAIALVVCAVWSHRSRLGGVARLLAGAAPILAALVIFKLFFAPANDVVRAQSIGRVVSTLQDVDRLRFIAAAVGRELWFGGASRIGVLPILAMFVLATGIRRPLPFGPIFGLACAGALIAADILVYALTPHDLPWQLGTSLDRVIVQVFPVIVWCGISLARVSARQPRSAASTTDFSPSRV